MAKLPFFPHNKKKIRRWTGLARYLTFSYISITIASFLLLEILLGVTLVIFNHLVYQPLMVVPSAKLAARLYAQEIASQIDGANLDSRLTFEPGMPNSIDLAGIDISPYYQIIPMQRRPATERVNFALVLQPDGRILTSTYRERYPPQGAVEQLLPQSMPHILRARQEATELVTEQQTSTGRVVYAIEPVYNNEHKLIGIVYAQCIVPALIWLEALPQLLLLTAIPLVIIVVPIGIFFSTLTVRKPVHRLRNLVRATTYFADGNYEHRVQVSQRDEIGQLEHQLNRMAAQLAESVERQKELSEQNARLSERARIARELHDAISQDLFSLSMLAGGLQGALADNTPLRQELALLEQTTGKVIREMRALLLELHPLQLEHMKLEEALEELAFTYDLRLGISVQTNLVPVSLSPKVEQTLLRIVQEALTNAVRHASARTISISLMTHDDKVELCISDDGKGFSPEQVSKRHGLGLSLMQERVLEINGDLQLKSSPGQGTSICIQVPREEQHDQGSDRG